MQQCPLHEDVCNNQLDDSLSLNAEWNQLSVDVTELSYLANSPAAFQWKKIGIKSHHGIAVPLFSIHSSNSYGIGEYPDLLPLIDWVASIGFDVIQLLPLNDCGLGISPYSALSAFALNPLYLGLKSLPHISEHPFLQEELKTLPKFSFAPRVDYSKVREYKERFLHHYHEIAGPQIINSSEYRLFIKQATWLQGYTAFKILKNKRNWKPWETWQNKERAPTAEFLEELIREHQEEADWHYLVQFLCDQQMKAAQTYAESKNLLLMGDIPILIDRESADCWLHQECFNFHYSAGSPPDIYSENGQNWGFPIYNWEALEKQNYSWWINRLKWASHYYHLYRLDHIVGFFRIWSIPMKHKGKEGHYIPQDRGVWIDHGQRILHMMLNACEMLPIGEDLGVVPPEVKTCLNALGICGTRVMRWERKWEENRQYIKPQDYPLESMTTVSTHDSETLAHWWKNFPADAQLFADFKGWTYHPILSREHHREILWDSHHTNSLFHINLLQEYLSLIPGLSWETPEEDRINIPGIVSDCNWTYRYKPSIEEIAEHKSLQHSMQELLV